MRSVKEEWDKYWPNTQSETNLGSEIFNQHSEDMLILENRHFEGERGLEMIAHQKPRLVEFLRNNRSVKLNIRTEALFEKPEYDDGGNDIGSQELVYALPSTRFNISNEDELTQALEDSVKQILFQNTKFRSISI